MLSLFNCSSLLSTPTVKIEVTITLGLRNYLALLVGDSNCSYLAKPAPKGQDANNVEQLTFPLGCTFST